MRKIIKTDGQVSFDITLSKKSASSQSMVRTWSQNVMKLNVSMFISIQFKTITKTVINKISEYEDKVSLKGRQFFKNTFFNPKHKLVKWSSNLIFQFVRFVPFRLFLVLLLLKAIKKRSKAKMIKSVYTCKILNFVNISKLTVNFISPWENNLKCSSCMSNLIFQY